MKPTDEEVNQLARDTAIGQYGTDDHEEYESTVNGYIMGYNEAISKMQSEWIPIAERMPERHVDVLVFFIGAWKNKPVYKVDNYTIDGFWQNTSNNIITHWMPLPEPPNH